MQERFDTLGAPVFIFSNERKAMSTEAADGLSEMIVVRTAELIGPALNWAVAMVVDYKTVLEENDHGPDEWIVMGREDMYLTRDPHMFDVWSPSTDWSQGGPLIEKFKVMITPPNNPVHHNFGPFDSRNGWCESGHWGSTIFGKERKHRRTAFQHSDSPLIVAMRAIVQCELGDVVSVPVGLVAEAVNS